MDAPVPSTDPVRNEDLHVFVPGLMGVGILLSGALIMADWLRRLFPSGGVRRKQRVALGAQGLVIGAARTAGYRLVAPSLDRRQVRSRWIYLVFATACVALGLLAFRTGVTMFRDETGLLYRNPWAMGLGLGFGIGLVAVALVTLLPAVYHRRPPFLVNLLVQLTWLGRIPLPPTGYHTEFLVVPATPEEEMSR